MEIFIPAKSQFDSSGEEIKAVFETTGTPWLHSDAAVIYIHCQPMIQELKQNELCVPKCHQQLSCRMLGPVQLSVYEYLVPRP
jgi:hypothetical protein